MNRQLLAITVVAAMAFVTAPAALATGMHPDDRAYARGTVKTPSLHPDDRAVARSTVADRRPVARGTHPDDRAFARAQVSSPQPVLVRVDGPGFDWVDATIGAAGGLGIALMLLGTTVGIQRRRVAAA